MPPFWLRLSLTDVTSNRERERDGSLFRICTCFCGKGWKSSTKMLARCFLEGCYNKLNLLEVLFQNIQPNHLRVSVCIEERSLIQ